MVRSCFIHTLAQRSTRRAVLLCFALALWAAMLSPWLQPRTLQLVCSANGALTLVAQSDALAGEGARHGIDCALCLGSGGPMPTAAAAPRHCAAPLWVAPAPAAPTTSATLPPMPARGPPIFS